MTEKFMHKGQCLCGAVTFTATPAKKEMGACHCTMCRRWSAGPLMMVGCDDQIAFEGKENIGIYQSSAWGERGFCKKCGTSLFWKTVGKDHYVVSANAFDDPEQFRFSHQIFVDEKPDNYEFANKTDNMTGAQVFAMFADDGDGTKQDG